MRRRRKKGSSGFNVWRSYSDMMAGLLLLFVLIMCVTLFQAQKSYDESIKERDERIAMQEQVLSQQTVLDEQKGQIDSQDALLAAQQAKLKEYEETLNALAAQLAAQQTTLDEQSAQLSAQELALNEKTALLLTQQAQIDQIIGVKADVIAALKDEFTGQNLNVDIDSTGALMLDSNVMFAHNEAELTEEGMNVLQQVLPIYCQVLLQDEYQEYLAEIIIEGHTDTSGSYEYNLNLSQQRSLAVAQYLLSIQEQFLSGTQIESLEKFLTVNGHSMGNPIVGEDGNIDMDASRRVEVKFRLKDEEMLQELTKILGQQAETEAATESEEASESQNTGE